MEVYQTSEIDVLKKKKACPDLFGKEDTKQDEEVVEFTHEGATSEYSWCKTEDKKPSAEKTVVVMDDKEEIDWDEI